MDARAMAPFAAALWDYYQGDHRAEMIFRRDDGVESRVPAAHFLREPEAFSPIENRAVESCQGHVLDVGAGWTCTVLESTEAGDYLGRLTPA